MQHYPPYRRAETGDRRRDNFPVPGLSATGILYTVRECFDYKNYYNVPGKSRPLEEVVTEML
jgi:hypothetical protein